MTASIFEQKRKAGKRIASCFYLQDKRMQGAIERGEAMDISFFPRTKGGEYILPEYLKGLRYCDCRTEQWIYSIGVERSTGEIHAATNTRLFANPGYRCLWVLNSPISQ